MPIVFNRPDDVYHEISLESDDEYEVSIIIMAVLQ